MAKLGWHQDTHQTAKNEDPKNKSFADTYGPQEKITRDIQTLHESYGVEHTFFTGDMTHESRESWHEPATPPEAYDYFWSLVDNSGYGNKVWAVPGNHELPTQPFFESDERAVRRAKFSYDDGVSVFLIDSQANTATMAGGQYNDGVGLTVPRIRHTDIMWLDEQLDAAGDDLKIVLPHAHIYFSEDSSRANYSPNGQYLTDNMYWNVSNFRPLVYNIFSNYNKVVVPQSHDYKNSGAEGYATRRGAYYLYKNHYYDVANDQVAGTFGYIEGDSTYCKVKTINPSDGSVANTILDVTF